MTMVIQFTIKKPFAKFYKQNILPGKKSSLSFFPRFFMPKIEKVFLQIGI